MSFLDLFRSKPEQKPVAPLTPEEFEKRVLFVLERDLNDPLGGFKIVPKNYYSKEEIEKMIAEALEAQKASE